jgi:ABC-type arginine/histidine transport system permease subunit
MSHIFFVYCDEYTFNINRQEDNMWKIHSDAVTMAK